MDQSQLVVEVGRHGDACARAQDLSGVASGRAPRVQREGEKPQHGMESDGEDGSVAGGQVKRVDGPQCWSENGQDEQAVEETSNHILGGKKKKTKMQISVLHFIKGAGNTIWPKVWTPDRNALVAE